MTYENYFYWPFQRLQRDFATHLRNSEVFDLDQFDEAASTRFLLWAEFDARRVMAAPRIEDRDVR